MANTQFTTIRTADLLDSLVAAVDAARDAASVSPSWLRAIDAAYDYLLTTDEISYDLEHKAIRVESASTAGTYYTANGDCGCAAFTKGKGICWHRAAARLVRRALELGAPVAPAVRVEPCINDDKCDPKRFGTVTGYDYIAEVDGVKVIGWAPNERGTAYYPAIILDGYDVIPVERARAVLRALTAVLADPRFAAAAA